MTCRNGSHYECDKGCQWLKTCEERKSFLANHLVKAVLEWEDADDNVAENGWTTDNESAWDNRRTEMISLANQLKEMPI